MVLMINSCMGTSRKTTEQFIQEAINVHGDLYDYTETVYKTCRINLEIVCRIHGAFMQRPSSHLNGYGCNKCGVERTRKTTEQFIYDAKMIHGNRYDYSNVKYKTNHDYVDIICPKHGIFSIKPNGHLDGKKCYKCSIDDTIKRNTKTTDQFIKEAKEIYGDRYDYSKTDYKHGEQKVKIICKKHGSFWQTPHDHLSGRNCAQCKGSISVMETRWLNRIGLPNNPDHRQVYISLNDGKRKRPVDGYNPTTNTVYEFYGDYWHGNPNTTDHTKTNPTSKKPFRQLYEETLHKEKLIKQTGYNLVTMWESDWKNSLT